MKIAFTGAGGMLGHAIRKIFPDFDTNGFTHDMLDITVLDDVVRRIKDVKPDFFIHAAAYTNVDQCESEAEHAYLVNGTGTRNIAMACEEIRCPLVYISTDYVFDGTKDAPYDEWDSTNPINKYGLSKLMGERFVSTLTSRFYIVRTSWLYGAHGRNFVDTIVRLLSERDKIEVVNDQTGCPTYTIDLAKALKALIGKGYGIYHITNSGSCTWYDFAVKIAEFRGLKKEIIPTTSDKFVRPAKRPPFSVLNNTMLRLEGIQVLQRWEEALGDYLKDV